jgi:hypothetical protein
MGSWIELGIFLAFIAFGFHQLHDLVRAQRERRAREAAAKRPGAASNNQQAGVCEP